MPDLQSKRVLSVALSGLCAAVLLGRPDLRSRRQHHLRTVIPMSPTTLTELDAKVADIVAEVLIDSIRAKTLSGVGQASADGQAKIMQLFTPLREELAAKDAEIERLRERAEAAELHLRDWVFAIEENGTSWDDWDDNFKCARSYLEALQPKDPA